jgi:hypothetical protein
VQAAGGVISAVAEAVGRRRAAVGSLVESGIYELARWQIGGGPRRQEIREIVDQLVLRGGLAASWIDGTLRELPEQSVGFDSFADIAPLQRPGVLAVVPVELAARGARARTKAQAVTASEQAERGRD